MKTKYLSVIGLLLFLSSMVLAGDNLVLENTMSCEFNIKDKTLIFDLFSENLERTDVGSGYLLQTIRTGGSEKKSLMKDIAINVSDQDISVSYFKNGEQHWINYLRLANLSLYLEFERFEGDVQAPKLQIEGKCRLNKD